MVNVKVIHQKNGQFKSSDMLTIQLAEFSQFKCQEKFSSLTEWDCIVDTISVIIFERMGDNMLFILCEENINIGIQPICKHNIDINKRPYWAKYKAINSDGTAFWYENKPINIGADWTVEEGRYAPIVFKRWCFSLTDLD